MDDSRIIKSLRFVLQQESKRTSLPLADDLEERLAAARQYFDEHIKNEHDSIAIESLLEGGMLSRLGTSGPLPSLFLPYFKSATD